MGQITDQRGVEPSTYIPVDQFVYGVGLGKSRDYRQVLISYGIINYGHGSIPCVHTYGVEESGHHGWCFTDGSG
jgi:hypothetical protein